MPNNMHTAGLDEEDDVVNDIMEEINNGEAQQTSSPENNTEQPATSEESNESNSNTQENFTENQTQSMIVLVWILLIISIICIIMTNLFGGKSSNKSDKNNNQTQASYLADTIELDSITAEDNLWKSEITVSKKIQVTDGNIIPLLYGYDNNYKRQMTVPVTMDEYNSINTGDVIEINYSRLKIDGNEIAIIKKWTLVSSNNQLEPA